MNIVLFEKLCNNFVLEFKFFKDRNRGLDCLVFFVFGIVIIIFIILLRFKIIK